MKTILQNRDTTQPVINHLVFEMNDLVNHTYQFIRLYVLHQYTKKLPLPELNETFILYCNARLLRDIALNNKFKNYLNLLFIFIIIQKKLFF